MLSVIVSLTKYFSLFISCFYSYIKLMKIKLQWLNILDLFVAALFSTALYFSTIHLQILLPTFLLILSSIYNFIRYRFSFHNTISVSTIACGLVVFIFIINSIISLPLDYIFYKYIDNSIICDTVSIVILCILQFLLIFILFKIKRFRSGISLQTNDGNIELLFFISIFCIFIMTLFYAKNAVNSPIELLLVFIIFCGLALIIWWRKHIKNNYQRQLYSRNELIYEQRIEEYEKERVELLNQNNALAKIIHRDNKLIPAMVDAVNNLIKRSENIEGLQPLLTQLENLSAERQTIISNYQTDTDNLPNTKIIALDAVLHYLYNKAKQNKVNLEISLNNDCIPLLLSKVTDMTELITLICDLGENAIIATKEKLNGNILLSFGLSEELVPYFNFYDNGSFFDKKVIANMGRRRITTHKEDGGNGIGLMTLFEILNKYNASYSLNEQLINSEFTKCIEVTFDGLHNKTFILNN